MTEKLDQHVLWLKSRMEWFVPLSAGILLIIAVGTGIILGLISKVDALSVTQAIAIGGLIVMCSVGICIRIFFKLRKTYLIARTTLEKRALIDTSP